MAQLGQVVAVVAVLALGATEARAERFRVRVAGLKGGDLILVSPKPGLPRGGDRVLLRTASGHYVKSGKGGKLALTPRASEATWLTIDGSKGAAIDGKALRLMIGGKGVILGGSGSWGKLANQVMATRFLLTIDPGAPKLSAPFSAPEFFLPPMGVDRDRRDPDGDTECKDFKGRGSPNCYDQHEGVDYVLVGGFPAVNLGSIDVVAVAAGTVKWVESGHIDRCFHDPRKQGTDKINCLGGNKRDANAIAILHDDGLVSYYYHLKRNSVTVAEEQRVECGQLLGKVASSGDSSSPHLHFELRKPRKLPTVRDDWELVMRFRNQSDIVDPNDADPARIAWAEYDPNTYVPKPVCGKAAENPLAQPPIPRGGSCTWLQPPPCELGLVCNPSSAKCEDPALPSQDPPATPKKEGEACNTQDLFSCELGLVCNPGSTKCEQPRAPEVTLPQCPDSCTWNGLDHKCYRNGRVPPAVCD